VWKGIRLQLLLCTKEVPLYTLAIQAIITRQCMMLKGPIFVT